MTAQADMSPEMQRSPAGRLRALLVKPELPAPLRSPRPPLSSRLCPCGVASCRQVNSWDKPEGRELQRVPDTDSQRYPAPHSQGSGQQEMKARLAFLASPPHGHGDFLLLQPANSWALQPC